MRTGTRCCFRQSASMRTLSSPPMLPGLMRTLAMPLSMDRMARPQSKWMSATSGTGLASTSARTFSAQRRLYTEMRTISAPASAMARIWASVASVSSVRVLVMV